MSGILKGENILNSVKWFFRNNIHTGWLIIESLGPSPKEGSSSGQYGGPFLSPGTTPPGFHHGHVHHHDPLHRWRRRRRRQRRQRRWRRIRAAKCGHAPLSRIPSRWRRNGADERRAVVSLPTLSAAGKDGAWGYGDRRYGWYRGHGTAPSTGRFAKTRPGAGPRSWGVPDDGIRRIRGLDL